MGKKVKEEESETAKAVEKNQICGGKMRTILNKHFIVKFVCRNIANVYLAVTNYIRILKLWTMWYIITCIVSNRIIIIKSHILYYMVKSPINTYTL